MAVALALLTVAFSFEGFVHKNPACVLAAMFLYIGGYQVGFGPIVWTLISEVRAGVGGMGGGRLHKGMVMVVMVVLAVSAGAACRCREALL
jgi:hypothetical protein